MNVLFLPDGNRRWARDHGVDYETAYRRSVRRLGECATWLHARGAREMWVAMCSIGNLERPREEVEAFLRSGLAIQGSTETPLAVTTSGRLDLLPGDFAERYRALEREPPTGGFTLHWLIAWSVDDEVVQLVNHFAGRPGPVDRDDVLRASMIKQPIDVIVRTGRAARLSALIPWHSPYAELRLSEKHFPDFGPDDLAAIAAEYARGRTYGR
jgi:undecaprenyl diphosphate synthase